MPNKDGIILGGETIRGFNENTMRGYPLWLPLTTVQVTEVVMRDEDILCAKGGRHVPDNSQVISDPEEKREAVRRVCVLRYLDGYPDIKVIDPIKENYPACTMPLLSTSPTYVTPEIMRSQQYAREYLEHVALIRELLDQASLSTNSTLLCLSNNRLFQSLSGLLNGASNCTSTGEPIPVWSLVRLLRTQANAELVRQTTMLMDGKSGISINMPCAARPVPVGDAPAFMHKRLVTSLTGNQPYYMRGGLIPHLTRKGSFWKSQAPAIHIAVLKFGLHIDAVNSAHLDKMEKIDCGWMPPLPRVHHYDGNTGLHLSLGPDCSLQQDGTTAKAASPAPPPTTWSNSVQGLTRHFEQMSMRNTVNTADMGHIPDNATAEVSQMTLKHDEINTELYTGHILALFKSPSARGVNKNGVSNFLGSVGHFFFVRSNCWGPVPSENKCVWAPKPCIMRSLGLKMQQKQVRETFRKGCQTCFCAIIAFCCRDF